MTGSYWAHFFQVEPWRLTRASVTTDAVSRPDCGGYFLQTDLDHVGTPLLVVAQASACSVVGQVSSLSIRLAVAPNGATGVFERLPTAYAVGYFFRPLCGNCTGTRTVTILSIVILHSVPVRPFSRFSLLPFLNLQFGICNFQFQFRCRFYLPVPLLGSAFQLTSFLMAFFSAALNTFTAAAAPGTILFMKLAVLVKSPDALSPSSNSRSRRRDIVWGWPQRPAGDAFLAAGADDLRVAPLSGVIEQMIASTR